MGSTSTSDEKFKAWLHRTGQDTQSRLQGEPPGVASLALLSEFMLSS